MSLDEMAKELKMAKSTLYYHMRKLGVKRRSRSEAQKQHLKGESHQRTGKMHSEESKVKISDGTREFWDSEKGQDQKQHLRDLRLAEWDERDPKERAVVLKRLQDADRPAPGDLSRFGEKLVLFLDGREKTKTAVTLVAGHISDIVLPEHKVVIELLLPIAVYGKDQEAKLQKRYNTIADRLSDIGYRMLIVEDSSNSISRARCQRVYDKLLQFFKEKHLQRLTIVS